MKKEEQINIIIPTRERANTLIHSLHTVVSQDYENLNIIVSDNFSHDNTKEVVASFADKRIKYINTGKRVSMSHNWEFALSHVTGGWVSVIGDDDGLLPSALKRVNEIIDATGTSAITSPWCHYYWPNLDINCSSELTIPMRSGWERRNAKEWLSRLMNGHANYPDLPWIYTGGFVHLSVLNNARSKNGTFFQSCIPDVYSAIALASIGTSYVYLKEPVAIAGVSRHSNGASCLGINNEKKPEELFYSEGNIPFHHRFGSERISSIPMLVYESYLQAEFLHNDELKISMEDQLAMAISKADGRKKDEIYESCKRVSALNGIDFSRLEAKLKAIKAKEGKIFNLYSSIRHRIGLFLRKIRKTESIKLNGTEFGARNVYDISLIAYVIRQSALGSSSVRRS
jgi:glycosyltransferase involved in cell wall biosynthesis